MPKYLISRILYFGLVGLTLLIGTALRVYRLGSFNLWFDELFSLYWAKELSDLSFFSFSNFASLELNPPLYYFLLAFWINLFGQTEFALRLLSVLFGILSILAIYKIGKLFFGRSIGLISALIYSISPLHIWYAQEVRGYTLITLLIILSAYFFFLALEKNKWYQWSLFVILLLLSTYTNYHSFFIIPAAGLLTFFKRYRHLIRRYLISCFFILIGLFPWLFCFSKQIEFVKEVSWIPTPELKSILITFENFNIGYNGTPLTYLFSFIIFSTLFILGFLNLRKEKLAFLSFFLFIPLIITFLISQWIPIYMHRNLLAFSPFYYLFVGNGFRKLNLITLKIGIFFAYIILASISLYNYYSGYMMPHYLRFVGTYTKKPFEPSVRYVKERFREGDIIAHSNPQTLPGFGYYGGFEAGVHLFYFVIPQAQDKYWMKGINMAWSKGFTHILDLSKSITEYNFERIWLISSSWARDYTLDEDSAAVREWMEENYDRVFECWFDGILVGLYEKRD